MDKRTVTSEGRYAIYLQDAHPLREGMALAQYAEAAGFGCDELRHAAGQAAIISSARGME